LTVAPEEVELLELLDEELLDAPLPLDELPLEEDPPLDDVPPPPPPPPPQAPTSKVRRPTLKTKRIPGALGTSDLSSVSGM
jgi:hypothetical protein